MKNKAFQVAQWFKKKKNPPANAGDARALRLIPGLGRSPGVGNGNLLQYPCYKIPWIEVLRSVGLQESDMTE